MTGLQTSEAMAVLQIWEVRNRIKVRLAHLKILNILQPRYTKVNRLLPINLRAGSRKNPEEWAWVKISCQLVTRKSQRSQRERILARSWVRNSMWKNLSKKRIQCLKNECKHLRKWKIKTEKLIYSYIKLRTARVFCIAQHDKTKMNHNWLNMLVPHHLRNLRPRRRRPDLRLLNRSNESWL